MSRRTVRGIPLTTLVILGIVAGIAVYAAAFQPWVLINELTAPTPAPTTYQGDPKIFTISTAGEDNMAIVTLKLTSAIATPNTPVTLYAIVEVKKLNWKLGAGCTLFIDIKNPDATLLKTITIPMTEAIGKGTEAIRTYPSTFTTGSQVGDYTIAPRITGMVWTQP